MKRDEILSLIRGLAHSQGSYGRLYEDLVELKEGDEDYFNLLMTAWEECNFDQLGLIDFIEVDDVNIWSVEDINKWKEERKCI